MTHPDTPGPAAGIPPCLLVTGGSRGIGAATARLAAQRGWDVAVNYTRDEAAAEAVAADVRACGRRALVLQADVGDEAQVVAMFATHRRAMGPAGRPRQQRRRGGRGRARRRHERRAPAAHVRDQRLRLDVVRARSAAAHEHATRRQRRRHRQPVLGRGRLGAGGQYVDYAAAKGAIDVFTLGLAREVAAEGVRVNAVRPGIIDTDIHASGGQPDRVAQMVPLVPMQRAGSRRRSGAGDRLAAGRRQQLHHRRVVDVTGGR